MKKSKTNEQKTNFILNALPPNTGLKRDEPSLVVRVLCLGVFFLLVIDIAVVIFYIKTSTRIDAIRNDNFTDVVMNNLLESEQKHENFANRAKEIIRNKNSHIKEFVDHLEFDSKAMEKIDLKNIDLPSLEGLRQALMSMEGDQKITVDKLKRATVLYNEVEQQMKKLNNYLMPIDEFNSMQERIEKGLKVILDEIKENLDNFARQLDFLAQTQNENQKMLLEEMKATLSTFERIYNFVYKDKKYSKLNNYFEEMFIEFDRDYVPFSMEFDNQHFGAQLTKENFFKLRMPRMYYCTLQAVILSDNPFNVRLQFIDKSDEENVKDTIVFESESLQGGFDSPFSYGEVKMFGLSHGTHRLYLRIISEGRASQLYMNQMRMICLSYRNFGGDASAVIKEEIGKPINPINVA